MRAPIKRRARFAALLLASVLAGPACFSQEAALGAAAEKLDAGEERELLLKDLEHGAAYGYRCHLDEWKGGVTATPQQTQGALEATGTPTDIAVCGRGFFRIALGKGRYAYTRDGRMRINSEGELEFAGGYGTGIRLPAASAGLVIARDGRVESMGADGSVQLIGRIALYNLPAGSLRDAEHGFYEAAEATPLPEDQVCLVQGCLEQSNVDVAETLELLRLLREGDSADTEYGSGKTESLVLDRPRP
jgi:hypothetical protein